MLFSYDRGQRRHSRVGNNFVFCNIVRLLVFWLVRFADSKRRRQRVRGTTRIFAAIFDCARTAVFSVLCSISRRLGVPLPCFSAARALACGMSRYICIQGRSARANLTPKKRRHWAPGGSARERVRGRRGAQFWRKAAARPHRRVVFRAAAAKIVARPRAA